MYRYWHEDVSLLERYLMECAKISTMRVYTCMVSLQPCSDSDVGSICRLHTLWALHIDPFVDMVTEIVSALLRSSCPELLGVLRRVCAQLADLSPSLATLVAR